MNKLTQRSTPSTLALWLCGLALLAGPVTLLLAAPARPDVHQRYQREQARCMALRVVDDRANCLSESSTAYQAALPPVVDPDPGRYARNALERCKALRDDGDRRDCVSRMQGQGTTSGSVAAGGIYRELVTRDSPTAASSPTR